MRQFVLDEGRKSSCATGAQGTIVKYHREVYKIKVINACL